MPDITAQEVEQAVVALIRTTVPAAKVTTLLTIDFGAGTWGASMKSDTDNKRVHAFVVSLASLPRAAKSGRTTQRMMRFSIIGVLDNTAAGSKAQLISELEMIADATTISTDLGLARRIEGHDELQINNIDFASGFAPPAYFADAELQVRCYPITL